ncbi:MAG: DNA repair protein RecO [Kiritimatiellia bacterium]|jgi:DNA repair protein RecO
MIAKTEAIVLRIFPFSRTSHIVAWLAEDGARLTTSVKGAVRPKSAFLGQYDLFYTCELLYYERERDGVHIARECTPLDCRETLRANWRAAQCASWFAALAYQAAASHESGGALYRLLAETLDFIAATPGPPPAAVFARFEAKILDIYGLAPNVAPCATCGPAPDATRRFNLADGAFRCPEHAPGDPRDPLVALSPRTVELYEALRRSPSLGLQSPVARCRGPAVHALLRFLGLFIRYHLADVAIDGRATALRALGPG